MTYTQVAYWSLVENNRANLAREAETKRDNKARLAEAKRNNIANLAEQTRSHKVNESISERTLAETIRANQAREAYQQQQINLGYANLAESHRASVANESIRWFQNYETQRNNNMQNALGYANVALGYSNLAETNRANLENESIRRTANTNNWLQYAVASQGLEEQKRHNLATENQAKVNNITNASVAVGTSLINAVSRQASGAAALAGAM